MIREEQQNTELLTQKAQEAQAEAEAAAKAEAEAKEIGRAHV